MATSERRSDRAIIINPREGVIVPAIIPVVALISIASVVISISYLGMKHRERMEKIKRGNQPPK